MKTENKLRMIGRLIGREGEEGSSLVEFALTLPMLFGLIYLAATLTLGMYNLQQLGNATSATAMAVGSDVGLYPSNDPCAFADSTMTKSLPTWTPGSFSYSLVVSNASGTASSPHTGKGGSFTCPLGTGTMGANYPLTLTVTYTYSWLGIPAMPYFNAGTNTAGSLVSSQSAIQM